MKCFIEFSLLVCLCIVSSSNALAGSTFSSIETENAHKGKKEMTQSSLAEKPSRSYTLRNGFYTAGLAFSPDGRYLASTSSLDTVKINIWDLNNRQLVRTLSKGAAAVSSGTSLLQFSPDSKHLAACHARAAPDLRLLQVWESDNFKLTKAIVEPNGGSCEAIVYSSDGKYLFRIDDPGPKSRPIFIAHNTLTWGKEWELEIENFYPKTLSINSSGRYAAIGGMYYPNSNPFFARIVIVDLLSKKVVNTIDPFPAGGSISSSAWGKHDDQIAVGLGNIGQYPTDDGVIVFDALNGKKLAVSKIAKDVYVQSVEYSPNGEYLVFTRTDDTLHICDSSLNKEFWVMPRLGGALRFSNDGRHLAVGRDSDIHILEMH